MQCLRRLSRARLFSGTHAILAGMVVAVALYAAVASYATGRITRQMALGNARDLGEMLATWARGPIERREWAELNNLAAHHSANPGIQFVCFLIDDAELPPTDGPISSRTVQPRSAFSGFSEIEADLPEWAVLEIPIRSDPSSLSDGAAQELGIVLLGVEPTRLANMIDRAQYGVATGSAVLGSIILVLVGLVWKRSRRSVELLAAQASRLLGKEWHDSAKGADGSAVGKVGAALGMLADELTTYKDQLDDLHSQIEKRVSERTELLRDLASRDPLTGLRNRRYFNETLEARFEEAHRYGDALSLAVIDVDDFKLINDQYGHVTGDEVLIALATTLTTEFRSADVAARFGGDEFVVLMPQTEPENARTVIDRVCEKFSDTCRRQFDGMHVTLSVGVAAIEKETECSTDFFAAADQAMYRAKNHSKKKTTSADQQDPHGASTSGAGL